MIHLKKEGQPHKSGLNITVGKWWVTFAWMSYYNYNATVSRLRIRLNKPKLFTAKHTWNVVEAYNFDKA